MKKILLSLLIISCGILIPLTSSAQLKGGLIAGTSATTTFTKGEQPFNTGCCLLGDLTIATKYTYHNLMYGFGDNSVKTLNGYFLPRDWDTYLVYSRGLKTGNNYLGWGLEQMLKADRLTCFLFAELGTDFKETKSLSVGILFSLQNSFWKK